MTNATSLLCTDGSQLALDALRAGLSCIAPADRTVVATVISPTDPSLTMGTGFAGGVMSPEEVEEQHRRDHEAATSLLQETISQLGLDGAEPTVLVGDPGHELCRIAEELSASVIVIGTRGHGGLRRAILGSVSDHVIRHAPCPVLTVAAEE